MSYAAWSVIAGEQPTTSKWNILGTNDQSFNDGTGIGNGVIGNSQLAAGSVVQIVETDYYDLSSQTATIPYDDTIPQNTEGFQVMTQNITPKATTNNLIIEANVYGSVSGLGELIGALFVGSTANAIAADSMTIAGSGYLGNVKLRAEMTAGTTSALTFNVRIGAPSGQNVAFNGFTTSGTSGAATRAFNTCPKSGIKITEIKV